jgi:hypothetical protein
MSRAKFGAVTFACLSMVAMTAGGCATEAAEEERAETSSAIERCDPYPTNPACSAPLFLRRAWELGVENAWDNAIMPAVSIITCFTALRAAGAIASGTRAIAPVVLSGSRVVELVGVLDGCKSTVSYLDRIGLPANISCFLQPQLYDARVHACMCRNECEWRPESLSYIDAMNNCHCTADAHEARCALVGGCGEWSTNDPSDPNYCACRRPP